ncbi:cysteine--tRNA ligase [Polynucleobacter sp. AP-Melu-500A-A1]|uniref:cysteine--tRNA ligase n=1 Tax=Polynucleobacter sp. AP-Melu-500A-A1 TaxID=2576929 RepID=UPI001C0B4896|nr:cysteine--tRNA ligase [Polynucleobacter sp. AP-Melu-500A-A1]MBU3630345.1 cysteine--tRNA ligase [Polynucleobacter sp. AP-Melu-500A-A1]
MLQIYNTLSRSKQLFKPIVPGKVKMYVCGMTVYDFCHIGHARVMIVFDMVVRWLRASGYEVIYVRNITDIDDKIINRAIENGEPISALTKRFIDAMHADSDELGLMHPDQEPRATDYIAKMQGMIGKLIENELAYQADDGDVNFAVRLFPNYGSLSGKSLDELNAGERVVISGGKRDPLDFALWKSAKPEEPVDTRWKSPWGEGRPGWHIECSAMSCELLGEHFDIHGGGADLQFPHHENEIAQSEGALYGKDRKLEDAPFVNYWMHNGHIRVNEEKMSKSLGNFFLIRDVLKSFDPEVLRFFMLKAHYRSPINYSDAQLEEARAGLVRLYTALAQVTLSQAVKAELTDLQNPWVMRFTQAMNDDFNTPEAIAVLFDLASEVNRTQGDEKLVLASTLQSLGGVLNFLQRDPTSFLQSGTKDEEGLCPAMIDEQIAARVAAKNAKDFAQADSIRKALLAQGIVLEDKPGGITEWRRA